MAAGTVVAIGLRKRILLLVALGLLIATAPLGVMGLGMVRAATDRILVERLAMARASADHLSSQLAQGWSQLERLSARVAARPAGDRAALRRALADFVPQTPLFSGGVLVLDASGAVLAAEPAHRAPLPSDLPSVSATLAQGRPQTGLVIRGPGGRSLAVFSVPVSRPPAAVDGAVVGLIDLTKPTLLTFIDGLAMGVSGHAAIVAADGTVLASTDPAALFTRDEHPEFFRAVIERGRALVGRATALEESGRREVHVTAFAPLTAVPWGVGIGQREDEALGPIRRLRDRIVIFETLVLLAAGLFAWWDTTAVVRPLTALRQAAERIAEGDLATPIDVRRADEIGALAHAFETMRLRLLRSLRENARLQEQLQSVAMLEERERIAREMHDSVGQVLGYVNTKAQAVRALLEDGKPAQAQQQLAELEQAARAVYADLREAILSLRTTVGAGQRLLPALAEYVRRFSELSGVETTLSAEGPPLEFPPTVEVHLIRIVQEALTNVRKHARARHAAVRLTSGPDGVVIAVEDDGVGIAARSRAPQAGSGFGLQTMQERAEAIGGRLTLRARPGGGTVVEVEVPVERGRDDASLAG
ncbi:MAG TPA: histidine kinase [bacterium]|nr:histidine kinase [bacterium]